MKEPISSTDYHDYVIKDGKFVGAFDEMYLHASDPWHQDEADRHWKAEEIALLLRSKHRYSRALDVGCGLEEWNAEDIVRSYRAPDLRAA